MAAEEINPLPIYQLLPALLPMRESVGVVLKGGMEKLPMPIEAETVVKVTMVRDTKEEMSSETRVMAMKAMGKPMETRVMSMKATGKTMEPPVESKAASGGKREFSTGEGWCPSQQRRQEHDEQRGAMSHHGSSPLPMVVGSLQPEARVDPSPLQNVKTFTPRSRLAFLPPELPDAGR
jgi:hypothetical protein